MHELACLSLAESQLLLQSTIGFYDFHIHSSSPPDLLQCPVFGNFSSGLLLLMLRSAGEQTVSSHNSRYLESREKWLSSLPALTLLLSGALGLDSILFAVWSSCHVAAVLSGDPAALLRAVALCLEGPSGPLHCTRFHKANDLAHPAKLQVLSGLSGCTALAYGFKRGLVLIAVCSAQRASPMQRRAAVASVARHK